MSNTFEEEYWQIRREEMFGVNRKTPISLIVRRRNLKHDVQNLPIAEITVQHLARTLSDVFMAERIIFIDINSDTKILKDRIRCWAYVTEELEREITPDSTKREQDTYLQRLRDLRNCF